MPLPSRYDAIVIGAGMSGLAAGIRLAQYEKRVIVLERHYLWGGLNSFYKREGRRIDTGLHALTNFAKKGQAGAPLTKMLRQLRIAWEDLALSEQSYSEIVFPGCRLCFSNDFALLEEEIVRAFPRQRDAFRRLVRAIDAHDPFDESSPSLSGRAVLATFIDEPLLVEMLLTPVAFYGSALEGDIDWDAFVILFRSIFKEGLARPDGGVKRILDRLVARYRELGGQLRLRAGVERILVRNGSAQGVRLEDGSEILAECILSSAGYPETMKLAGREVKPSDIGALSFVETIRVLDKPHRALGHEAVMTFFNHSDRFKYRRPEGLIDATSGVICCSDNYATREAPVEGVQRVTVLANHDRWCALDETEYAQAKERSIVEIRAAAAPFLPDERAHVPGERARTPDERSQTLFADAFTPRTIRQYTGHFGGAVYGSPKKRRDGRSGIESLHIIGTDQGLCGIVGALLSGITMANRHVLVGAER